MKRRYVLYAGVAATGTAWLSQYLPGRLRAELGNSHAKTMKKFEITKSDQEWRSILTSEQFQVLRQHGTEWAGSSPLDKEYGKGTYVCAGCALPLFKSETKYNSGTGWPSFWAPIDRAIGTTIDNAFGMRRVEVHCRRCGGHLGHVFEDGPQPTGKRYCMNGVALKFVRA